MIVNTLDERIVKMRRAREIFCLVYKKFVIFSKKLQISIAKKKKAWYNTHSKIW